MSLTRVKKWCMNSVKSSRYGCVLAAKLQVTDPPSSRTLPLYQYHTWYVRRILLKFNLLTSGVSYEVLVQVALDHPVIICVALCVYVVVWGGGRGVKLRNACICSSGPTLQRNTLMLGICVRVLHFQLYNPWMPMISLVRLRLY